MDLVGIAKRMVTDEACMKAFGGNQVLMLLANDPYPQDPRVRGEARTLATSGYQVSVNS